MISDELMLSILSMDAYNRGYDPGISGLSDESGSSIGNATITARSSSQAGSAEVNAGFYAISYTWNGQTVISYRGTDDVLGLGAGVGDVWNGWITGTGTLVNSEQAALAVQFYDSVTGGDVAGGVSGGAVLTGHSLGGGLAGFVASLTHDQAYVFDNMPYILAATKFAYETNLMTGSNLSPDAGTIHGFCITDEILQLARSLQFLTGPFVADPIVLAWAILNILGETQTALNPFTSNANQFTELHHQALVPLMLFAREEAAADQSFTGWQAIGESLVAALYDNAVGEAAGFQEAGVGGTADASRKMAMALAYSALDEGALVFGNTGIRAMFDDANELGGVIGAGHATAPLQGAMAGLVEAFVQYAGMLAFNKVDSTGQNSVNPLQGILSLLTGTAAAEDASRADTLLVDLSEARWNIDGAANAQLPEIVGLDTIFTGGLAGFVAANDNILTGARAA